MSEQPQQSDAKLEEKTKDNQTEKQLIVISGVTSGIGAGMLRKFMKLGHIVAGFGRRKENILALRKELNIEDETLITDLDITKTDQVMKWSETIVAKYGVPSVIIHNAGSTIGCNKDSWELDLTELMTSLSIHVVGSVALMKAFIPKMVEVNKGMVINISSWAGQNGYATGSPYVSSKHALEGLTKCVAKELVDKNPENQILACCVSPGFVNTPLLKGSFEETAAKQKKVENGDEWAEKTCEWILSLGSQKDADGKLLYHGKSIGPPVEKESMKKYCDFFKVYGVEMEYEKLVHEPK
eukprot:73568_1